MSSTAESTAEPVAPLDHRMRGSSLTHDLSFLLARANAFSLAAGNAALAEYGLRVRSYSVLALAVDDIRPSQRDLAAFLRLNPSQVVALVDDLEDRGLVRRESDPTDRRNKVVVATAEGQECFASAQFAARTAEQELHGQISSRQRDELAELLGALAFPA